MQQGHASFPIVKQVVYAFAKAHEESAARIFLRSFVGLSFSHHLLDLLGAQEAATSARVVKVALDAYLKKRKKVHLDRFSAWLRARKESRAPEGPGVPMLLPPLLLAGPSVLLGRGHSCKAITFSWLSKAGVGLPTRRLLGYHSQAGEKTPLVYSRDSMSGPV